uniref:Uncharacterized protein n=1 Tax=Oryza punctata TaxID=4537 RepID=A0A0E0LBZ4_ORYPU
MEWTNVGKGVSATIGDPVVHRCTPDLVKGRVSPLPPPLPPPAAITTSPPIPSRHCRRLPLIGSRGGRAPPSGR